jgi:hypothetical protein
MTFKAPLANATKASGNKSLQVIPSLYRARSAENSAGRSRHRNFEVLNSPYGMQSPQWSGQQ